MHAVNQEDVVSSAKVIIELAIKAPADDVWNALRDPDQIGRWFGWDAPTLADEIKFIFVDHAKADDEPRIIEFEGMPDHFEVVDLGDDGALVRLVRAGAAGDERDWDGDNEDMTEGWKAFLEQLRFMLERHRGDERRTIYLSGRPLTAGALPRDRIFAALAAFGVNAAARVQAPTGETLSGQVWHRSRRQISMTVESYGDGLVLVTDYSAGSRPPHGGGSAIITTYGLDDEAFTALRTRWANWWRENFPDGMKNECADEMA